MKKIISLILLITLAVSFSGFTFPENFHRAYNTNGSVYIGSASKAGELIASGWQASPVTVIYSVNGESKVVLTKDLGDYLYRGWYLSQDSIPKNTKAVALTYDDGPSKHTNRILDCLSRYGARATFFVVGTNVTRYPDILRRAHLLGMQIGNHTVNHPNLKNLSAGGVLSEINGNADRIESVLGIRPQIIRPPYGSYSKATIATTNQPFILWSIDTLDWKTRSADKTVASVLSNVKDGDIILMHDLYQSTAEATERIVPELIARGYSLVTVSELAAMKGVTMVADKYGSFK